MRSFTSSARDLRNVLFHIVTHTGNRKHRVFALLRFVYWQLRKRVLRRSMTITTSFGMRFKIVRDSKFSSLVYYTGLPDWDEMQFLLRVLRRSDGFIDIGANVGFYTLIAGSKVDENLIWAVEPVERNLVVLYEQLELNQLKRVNVIPFTLSHTSGSVLFGGEDRETGGICDMRTGNEEIVEARRLDELIADKDLPAVVFAKIDVEGGEMDVLRGSTRLLQSPKIAVFLFELSEENLRKRGHTSEDLLKMWERFGFRFYCWNEFRKSLREIDPRLTKNPNVIACRKDINWLHGRLREYSGE